MRSILSCTIVASSIAASSILAQNVSHRLDGGWINVRDSIVAPDTSYTQVGSPGLLVLSGRYFSQLYVSARYQGPQQASTPTTIERKAARYDALGANAGTQDIGDSLITIHVQHAKNPSIAGTTTKASYKLRGDTLWLTVARPWAKASSKTVRATTILEHSLDVIRVRARRGLSPLEVTYRDDGTRILASTDSLAAVEEASRRKALLKKGWSPKIVDAVLKGTIAIGMTAAMVREAWGEPEHVNTTITASGRREQWVYADGQYVYLDNGRVTAMQTSR